MLLLKMEVSGQGGFGNFDFSGSFSDIFEDFFSDFSGGRGRSRKNSNLEVLI